MYLIDTSASHWRVGKKTKTLRAKPMLTLLVDQTVMAKFLLDTLEAREPVSADVMFCIGESNDAWQQTAKAGWSAAPKPENSVQFFEVTAEMWRASEKRPGGDDTVYLRGQ